MADNLIRLKDSDVTPALQGVAKEILGRGYSIGTRVPFSIGKSNYMAVIEEHYHPEGGDRKPWGKHPGVSLFSVSSTPSPTAVFNRRTETANEPAHPQSNQGVEKGKYSSVAKIPGLENKSPEFIKELINIGNRLDINPSYIASVMRAESGFDHQAVNPMGGATGLIQFMPATAKSLNTTVEDLRAMSDVEQLKYVEQFFKPYSGRIKNPGDLYMATFLPIFLGKPTDFVIGELNNHGVISGNLTYHKVYTFNKGFDKDKDGKITVGDVTGRANSIYASGIKGGEIGPSDAKGNSAIADNQAVKQDGGQQQPENTNNPKDDDIMDSYIDSILRSLYAASINRKYSLLKKSQVFVSEVSDYESPLYQPQPFAVNLHSTPLGGGFDDVNPYTYTGHGASYQGFPEDLGLEGPLSGDRESGDDGEELGEDPGESYFSDENLLKKFFF